MPCPHDTDGDGDCGQRGCPVCGGGPNPYKDWSPYHVLHFEPTTFKYANPPKVLLTFNQLYKKLMAKFNSPWN